jgi:hypothetical protein
MKVLFPRTIPFMWRLALDWSLPDISTKCLARATGVKHHPSNRCQFGNWPIMLLLLATAARSRCDAVALLCLWVGFGIC